MRNIRRALKQTYFKLWMPETRAQHAMRTGAARNFGRTQQVARRNETATAR